MRDFFSWFFIKNNRDDISSSLFEDDIDALEIEGGNLLNQDEEIEFLGLHESALREELRSQRLRNEKKKAIL